MLNVIIFGAPGTGKGTQSENIIEKYGLIHLSTGDILREEIKNGSQIGLAAKKLIDDGLLVPDSIIIDLLFDRASKYSDIKGYIFDGFPRTTVQAKKLDETLEKDHTPISLVLYLDVTEEELFKRIMYRSQHSGRADDTADVIRKRIEVYKEQTQPLLDYYLKQDKLKAINGMGSIEEVFVEICSVLNEYLISNK
ncbi:MAG: adenylate kinase [Bacteroidota bacterium]